MPPPRGYFKTKHVKLPNGVIAIDLSFQRCFVSGVKLICSSNGTTPYGLIMSINALNEVCLNIQTFINIRRGDNYVTTRYLSIFSHYLGISINDLITLGKEAIDSKEEGREFRSEYMPDIPVNLPFVEAYKLRHPKKRFDLKGLMKERREKKRF